MIFYKKKYVFTVVLSVILMLICIVGYAFREERSFDIEQNGKVVFSFPSGFYEDAFELSMESNVKGTIYYTLDGSNPTKKSLRYEGPIKITDASNNPNVYSMRTDVSPGFDEAEIIRKNVGDGVPGYKLPDFLIDKATIVRAVVYDSIGTRSEIETASYFVGYQDKDGYEGMYFASLVTDPGNLFDYENGIYVKGKTYDEYVKEYRDTGEYFWREDLWGTWLANYQNRGKEWERPATFQLFDGSGKQILNQDCGIRIHGNYTRATNPRSLNLYAREKYGDKKFRADVWGTGLYPTSMTLLVHNVKDLIASEQLENYDVAVMHYIPCVLFLDGEYWGCYLLDDKFDENFFAHYYDVNPNNVIMVKNDMLELGEEDDMKYYSNMYSFCSSEDMTKQENYEHACELIDIESYTDYYASLIYLGRQYDWPMNNFALWRVDKTDQSKYGDGKWRWIVFDVNSPGFIVDHDTVAYTMENEQMFKNMMRSDVFKEKLFSKIETMKVDTYEREKMIERLQNYQTILSAPLNKQEQRFYGKNTNEAFELEIKDMISFFDGRGDYIDRILPLYR